MLDATARRLLETLPDDAVVLDVGGAMKPFNRANWIMDALPYEQRGELGSIGDGPERFSERTWVLRDFCTRERWPFDDKQIDFVICSHTLEDVRDPIWMCSEFNRIAKGGYIEVPSRLEEQTYGFQGPWTGWSHHRWLIDVDQSARHIQFVHKSAIVNGRDASRFPQEFRDHLSEAERVQTFWWEGSFSYAERLFWDFIEFDAYLNDYVETGLRERGLSRRELTGSRWRRLVGRG
jgi:Methyltransferase domain